MFYKVFQNIFNFFSGLFSRKHIERVPIPRKLREELWLKYCGNNNNGLCYCCGKVVNRYNGGWHAAHVISEDKGGETTLENLRVSCQHCNLSMGNQNLYCYIKVKKLKGPGRYKCKSYFTKYPLQIGDKRTNNYGKK